MTDSEGVTVDGRYRIEGQEMHRKVAVACLAMRPLQRVAACKRHKNPLFFTLKAGFLAVRQSERSGAIIYRA